MILPFRKGQFSVNCFLLYYLSVSTIPELNTFMQRFNSCLFSFLSEYLIIPTQISSHFQSKVAVVLSKSLAIKQMDFHPLKVRKLTVKEYSAFLNRQTTAPCGGISDSTQANGQTTRWVL